MTLDRQPLFEHSGIPGVTVGSSATVSSPSQRAAVTNRSVSSQQNRVVLRVAEERCHLCRRCLAQRVCKARALMRIDDDEAPVIDVHRCQGCRVCALECPYDAIADA